MKTLDELVQEEEQRAEERFRARVASGEDAREREAFRQRAEAEQARLEAHDCIDSGSAYEGLCPDCAELDCICNMDESGMEREPEDDDIEETE